MLRKIYILLICVVFSNCNEDNTIPEEEQRNFNMGFTTWSFGSTLQNVHDTYNFLTTNSDIYAEHIDANIPWNAWMNDETLPIEFVNEISGRVDRKIANKELLLSVSLLNSNRDELAKDFDGTIPSYTHLSDPEIEEAYFKHINYLVQSFSPNYLVIAIEVNELRLRAEQKWNAYQTLIQNVKQRIKALHPNLPISESVSLHNLYEPTISNPTVYINEIIAHMNQMDFVAISFYPFFKNQHTTEEFQQTFDFLHANINRPIAFVETSHLAENLIVPNLNVSINGNEVEQHTYLETLLANAQQQHYEFVIWWAHRDYDLLWETFPPELKDLGQLWRDTGLLDELGNARPAMEIWNRYLNQ